MNFTFIAACDEPSQLFSRDQFIQENYQLLKAKQKRKI